MAKRILDKWSRMVFGISTSYYDAGRRSLDDDEADNNFHDQDQYREMRRKLDRIKQIAQIRDDEEE